jgi:Bacterial dnaA protein helix-turn-helix
VSGGYVWLGGLAGDLCAEVTRVCSAPGVRGAVLAVAPDSAAGGGGAALVRVASRRRADSVIAVLGRAGFAVDPPSVRHVDTGPEPTLTVTRRPVAPPLGAVARPARLGGRTPPPAAAAVTAVTAVCFGLTAEDLRAPGRGDARTSFARQVAMRLCRDLCGLSLTQVGACFGGRHHATVWHADRKVRGMAAEPGPTRDLLALLAGQLAGPVSGRGGRGVTRS